MLGCTVHDTVPPVTTTMGCGEAGLPPPVAAPPAAIVIGPTKASSALCSLLGSKLLQGSTTIDTSSALAGRRFIGLYFSASWCPPCRAFTPKLVEWHQKHSKIFCMEIVRKTSLWLQILSVSLFSLFNMSVMLVISWPSGYVPRQYRTPNNNNAAYRYVFNATDLCLV